MIQISELRRVLVEEAIRLQPPQGLESRVLERAMRSAPAPEAGRQPGSRVYSPRVMALIAAALAVVIVATLAFASQALHLSRTAPMTNPGITPTTHSVISSAPMTAVHSVTVNPDPLSSMFIRQPIPLQPAAIAPCAVQAARFGCSFASQPTFGSANVGWTTDGSSAPEGPTNLYSTADGGKHWQAQLSWDYFGASEMTVSPDGRQALIVTTWGWQGPAIFQTLDAGSNWTSMGFPLSAAQAAAVAAAPPQRFCKGAILCEQNPGYFPYGQIYFANPREGWVLSQEPTYSVADLFHTTDGGAHWTLSGRFDIRAQFDLLPPASRPGPVSDLELHGQLVFESSSSGWYVPDYNFYPSMSLSVYRTLDGGASWKLQTIEDPPGLNSSQAHVVGMRFFNNHQGVVDVDANPYGGHYVYTTSDGGASWSHPNPVPTAKNVLVSIDFIDSQNWVSSFTAGHLIRTTDGGQHWTNFATNLPSEGSLDFVDLERGWAYTYLAYYLFGTSDGGAHWVKLTLPAVS